MAKFIQLNTGALLPTISLGTWKSSRVEVGNALTCALKVGYRHLDCAHIYGNEGEIGKALTAVFGTGTLKRNDIFVTSKLWLNFFHPDDVLGACQTTLKNLELDCLDLYLAHWPIGLALDAPPAGQIPMDQRPGWDVKRFVQTWKAMESLVDKGLVRSIGVSNFTVKKLTELLEEDIRIIPSVNQVESHIYLQQSKLKSFCKDKEIVFQAYSPLGSADRPAAMVAPNEPIPLKDPIVLRMAEKHKCSPAQVLISWRIQNGSAVVVKSVGRDRIVENFGSFGVKLDEDDVKEIERLDCGFRFVNGQFLLREGQTFDEFWDHE